MSPSQHFARLRRSRHLWVSRRLWRQRLVFWLGGLAAGGAAVLLAVAADYVQAWFRRAIAVSPYLALVITPAGLALSVYLTRRFFPGSQGSGIPQAIAAPPQRSGGARPTALGQARARQDPADV